MAEDLPETVVYVSNAGNPAIGVFSMSRDSGELTMMADVPVPGTGKPSPGSMPMAVTPDCRFLIAALRSDNFPATSFAIDPASGRLNVVATTPLTASMAYLKTDRAGRYLLAASYPGNQLSVNPIDASGRIGEKPTQIIPNRPKSHCILVDAANRHCYATSLGADIVMEWNFDPTSGTLTSQWPRRGTYQTRRWAAAFGTPPKRPVSLSDHRNDRHDWHLWHRSGLGDPRPNCNSSTRGPPDFTERPAAADLHVTPDGRFLYGSERKTSTLAGYRIDPDKGTLSPIGHWPTEKTPRGFNIDPRGRFLLSVGLDSNAMTVYRIDPQSGALSVAHQYPMGKMPNWIEIVDLR